MTILQDLLRSIGPMVGDAFDDQLLGLFDTAVLPLVQVGAIKLDAPVTSETEWDEVQIEPPDNIDISQTGFATKEAVLSAVRSYTYLVVKILFDPPASSVLQMINSKADEMLWRIEVAYHDYE